MGNKDSRNAQNEANPLDEHQPSPDPSNASSEGQRNCNYSPNSNTISRNSPIGSNSSNNVSPVASVKKSPTERLPKHLNSFFTSEKNVSKYNQDTNDTGTKLSQRGRMISYDYPHTVQEPNMSLRSPSADLSRRGLGLFSSPTHTSSKHINSQDYGKKISKSYSKDGYYNDMIDTKRSPSVDYNRTARSRLNSEQTYGPGNSAIGKSHHQSIDGSYDMNYSKNGVKSPSVASGIGAGSEPYTLSRSALDLLEQSNKKLQQQQQRQRQTEKRPSIRQLPRLILAHELSVDTVGPTEDGSSKYPPHSSQHPYTITNLPKIITGNTPSSQHPYRNPKEITPTNMSPPSSSRPIERGNYRSSIECNPSPQNTRAASAKSRTRPVLMEDQAHDRTFLISPENELYSSPVNVLKNMIYNSGYSTNSGNSTSRVFFPAPSAHARMSFTRLSRDESLAPEGDYCRIRTNTTSSYGSNGTAPMASSHGTQVMRLSHASTNTATTTNRIYDRGDDEDDLEIRDDFSVNDNFSCKSSRSNTIIHAPPVISTSTSTSTPALIDKTNHAHNTRGVRIVEVKPSLPPLLLSPMTSPAPSSRDHIRRRNISNEDEYICERCTVSFRTPESLLDHCKFSKIHLISLMEEKSKTPEKEFVFQYNSPFEGE